MKKAIFPFSADPLTFGHIDLIERAVKIFDQLIVVVLENKQKQHRFDLNERVTMVRQHLQSDPRVIVESFSGLLVDFAVAKGVNTIIRGLRNHSDLEYEVFLESGHRSQSPDLEFCYLLSDEKYRHVRSGMVYSILLEQGKITDYVPVRVKQRLEEKCLKQKKMFLTGGIASGKSYLIDHLKAFLKQEKIDLIHVDFDGIVDSIYREFLQGEHLALQQKIKSHFKAVCNRSGYVVKEKLSQLIFQASSKEIYSYLEFMQEILSPYIWLKYRLLVAKKTGLIFLDLPVTSGNKKVKFDFLQEANYHGLLVDVSEKVQIDRLVNDKSYALTEARKRVEFNSATAKKQQLEETIRMKEGKMIVYRNDHPINPDDLGRLYHQIKELF